MLVVVRGGCVCNDVSHCASHGRDTCCYPALCGIGHGLQDQIPVTA